MLLTQIAAKAEKYIDRKRLECHAQEINSFEHFYRARDFEASAKYCEKMLKEMGFEDVERYPLKMDGITANMDCIMPQAWDIEEGSFCKITDEDIPEEERLIADYAKDHFSCGIWSAPTPPEGIYGELLDGRNITEETVLTGKFILATENCASLYALGVAKGAAGILMFDGSSAAAKDFPDYRRWGNGIGLTGWYHTRNERRLVVYHITPRQGEYLHKLLETRSLTLHAVMNSRIFDGSIHTVTGIIPGKSREEVTFLAHLYEPFLTDDALGPASAVEICLALKALAEEKGKKQPEKTLRVVFSMELYGFSEYFTKKENVRKTFYAVSMDGIGTFNTWNHTEKKTVNIRLTPGSAPFFSDLLYRKYFLEKNGELLTPETRGCLSDDTFPADPMIRRIYGGMSGAVDGIPVNWLRTCTLPYHHNTGPMFNKADFDLAYEIIKACCAVIYVIADGEKEELKELLPEMKTLADKELSSIVEESGRKITEKVYTAKTANEKNLYWYALEKKVLLSVNSVAKDLLTEEEAEKALHKPALYAEEEYVYSAMEKLASSLVVTRLTGGIPTSLAKVPPAQRKKRAGIPDFAILMTFLDGKRDLLTAVHLTSFDQKTKLYTDQEIGNLVNYLRYLEKYGYVSIKETDCK
ncbi:MAG: hypothetical protein IKC08_06285 [Lentisphaeria bacterium]|nr:hypothetical protein [Lentisphaeria bacterium]